VNILLSRSLLVFGFCCAAVGAAGFDDPIEPLAWPLFGGGVVGAVVGGLLLRRAQRRRTAEGSGADALSLAGIAVALEAIAAEVTAIDEARETIEGEELCTRIDTLLTGAYFELGARNEDYARILGPATFARIWEGFAISERLLARTWSIATDGHLDEARAELPRARAGIEAAFFAAKASA